MFDPFVSKLTGFLDWEKKKNIFPTLEVLAVAATLQQLSVFQWSKWLWVPSTAVPAFSRNTQRFLVSLLESQVPSGECRVCLVGGLAAYRTLKLWAELKGASEDMFCSSLWEGAAFWGQNAPNVKSLGKYGGTRGARLQKHSAKASACRGRAAPVKGGALTPSRVLSYSKDKVFLL